MKKVGIVQIKNRGAPNKGPAYFFIWSYDHCSLSAVAFLSVLLQFQKRFRGSYRCICRCVHTKRVQDKMYNAVYGEHNQYSHQTPDNSPFGFVSGFVSGIKLEKPNNAVEKVDNSQSGNKQDEWIKNQIIYFDEEVCDIHLAIILEHINTNKNYTVGRTTGVLLLPLTPSVLCSHPTIP